MNAYDVGLLITLAVVLILLILILVWRTVLRPCNPIDGHDLMHNWESSGLRRQARRHKRMPTPTFSEEYTLYRCSRCGTRGWVKSYYEGGLLIHQIT